MKGKILLLLCIVMISARDEDPAGLNIRKIDHLFQNYVQTTHPQKIYLQLDKDLYFAGERIWFKGYLLEETTLTPDRSTAQFYVELINPYDHVVQTIRIKNELSDNSGSFYLADTVPEGIYQIRAYTNWMKNFGPGFFYTKNIVVNNEQKPYQITPREARKNNRNLKSISKDLKKFGIGFFPEGGELLDNIRCKVAFKAEDGYGRGVEVSGYITDKKGREIVRFRTEYAGMGSFYLTPSNDEKYFANVEFPDGSREKAELPQSVGNSVGLMLTTSDENIRIELLSNKVPSNDRSANEFVLIGQVRSKIYYAASRNILDAESTFEIPYRQFPSGIVHFTLINNRLQPVAERLFFVNHSEFSNYTIESFLKKDSVELFFTPSGQGADPSKFFMGSVSVVADNRINSNAHQNNIITELLLTNDLPGIIDEPSYYLKSHDADVRKNADLLMLTHGWKRFSWVNILTEKFPKITFDNETAINIRGKITRDILEIPIRNADVSLYIMNEYNDEFHTITNQRGIFTFGDLHYFDTIDVKIVARKPGGGKNLVILIEDDTYEKVTDRVGEFYLTSSSLMDMKEYRNEQARLARKELLAREKELDSIYRDNIYGQPDYVIWGKDLGHGYNNLYEALKGRVPGMVVSGDDIVIRGRGTILGNPNPLLIIDGVPSDIENLNNIPVQDVDRVEILKGPSTSIYGSRGGNGVIAVHTKRGTFMKRGEISFSMLGYHVSERFHSPETTQIKQRIETGQFPVTIYWNPSLIISKELSVGLTIPYYKAQGVYYVVIEGIDNAGNPGIGITSVDVK